jgi:predicted metal-binding membrane protein
MTMTGPAESDAAVLVVGNELGGWILMCIAMMGPATLAGVRHTGLNSLRWRRGRAMAEFSAAYLGVWTAFGIIALSLNAFLIVNRGLLMFAAILALAGAWQLTPFKRRALRDCHRSVPLPLRGWRAEKGSIRFGLRNGLSCVGSCWCLMLVMVVAPGYYLLWMTVLTGIVTTEKLVQRPRRATRFAANALWVLAAIVFAVAVNHGALE